VRLGDEDVQQALEATMNTRRKLTGILAAIAATGALSIAPAGAAAADTSWSAQAQYADGHVYYGTGSTRGAAERDALENCRAANSDRPQGCHSTGEVYRDSFRPYRYHHCDGGGYCDAQGGGHSNTKSSSGGGVSGGPHGHR
jgi:hypothetical protein